MDAFFDVQVSTVDSLDMPHPNGAGQNSNS